ncbi:hypothetical protein OBBRIDRAFT_775130, partial [Obba rivulosa]
MDILISSSSTTTTAKHPFGSSIADTVLRTADDVDFRVHSVILAEASTVFKTMFSLPQPEQVTRDHASQSVDGRPIITITETSEVMDSLLRLIYPVADPVLPTLQTVRPVLAAALKYGMEEATSLMKKALCSFGEENPLGVWAVACTLRLEKEARKAAEWSMKLPEILDVDVFPPEMGEVSAWTYHRLAMY